MPLPAIRKGTVKRCKARTKSRNLEQYLCPAAYGTTVCCKHGAVHPDKRAKGKTPGNFKTGAYTKDKLQEQTEQIAVLRNLEETLIVLDSMPNKRTRGNKPKGYQDIQTLEQAENYLLR